MADVIKVNNDVVTVFDEQDILEIILKDCGSDVYAWLQNYIDELKLQVNEGQKENEELEQYFKGEIEEYEQDIKEYRNEIHELNLEIGRLYRELRTPDVRLP